MHAKWFFKCWLHLYWVIIVTAANSYTSNSVHLFDSDDNISKSLVKSVNPHSNDSLSAHYPLKFERFRRAVVQAAPRLIDEKQCPEIRSLCVNLRDGADDLPVLECVQTFLSNQIETLSEECQHAIWTHTGTLLVINIFGSVFDLHLRFSFFIGILLCT